MKNTAKLIISFSLFFVIFFLTAVFVRAVFFWIDLARVMPVEAVPGGDFAETLWTAIPAALYFSILFSLAYSAGAKTPAPAAIICVAVTAFVFAAGISLGIERLAALKPATAPVSPVKAEGGLVLSGAGNSIILLRESDDVRGPRVVSIPGQPLIYQETPTGPNNTILSLPAMPLGGEVPWFLRSLGIDFSLSTGELKTRFEDNFLSFAAYAFSVILLLSSLRFLLQLSHWPLANIFLGALAFRFILALEIFLNSREINALLYSFLVERLPPALITPAVFTALAVLVIIYTLLAGIVRGGRDRNA